MLNSNITDPIIQHLSLLEEYDKTFKLYDHTDEPDLLSVFWMHPEEDPVSYNRTSIQMTEIMACGLPELTNESLSDLMRYPRHYLERLIERSKKAKEELNAAMNVDTPPPDKKK